MFRCNEFSAVIGGDFIVIDSVRCNKVSEVLEILKRYGKECISFVNRNGKDLVIGLVNGIVLVISFNIMATAGIPVLVGFSALGLYMYSAFKISAISGKIAVSELYRKYK